MNGWIWAAPLASFLGAGLAFLGAWAGTHQRESQSKREEWGRRFTSALDTVTSNDERARLFGRYLLGELARSELASREERELADRLLEEEARFYPEGGAGEPLKGAGLLDETNFVEDDKR